MSFKRKYCLNLKKCFPVVVFLITKRSKKNCSSTMSIPSTTEEEVFERRWDDPLSDVEAPVVEGDDSYTTMIRSL